LGDGALHPLHEPVSGYDPMITLMLQAFIRKFCVLIFRQFIMSMHIIQASTQFFAESAA
jgi:hypothetical protein